MKRMEDIYGLKSAVSNKLLDTYATLAKLASKVVIARRAGREYLHVLRFCKTL